MRALRLVSLLLATSALAMASCVDAPTANAPSPNASLLDGLGQHTGLLACTPLPYDSVAVTIGPEGGTLVVGPHALVVPEGALDAPVTITAVLPPDSVNRLRFQPEGLTFERPARLTMSYANCSLLGILLPKRIAWTDDLLEILDYLPSLDHVLTHRVTGQVRHFSNYAVAW